jgi:hypothetical protein
VPLVREAALAQFLQRKLRVCVRQQENDQRRAHTKTSTNGLVDVATFVVRMARTERDDCARVLDEHTIHGVDTGGLPPPVRLDEASMSDLGGEGAQWLTDLVVERLSHLVEVDEGSPESRGEQSADGRLSCACRTDQDQRTVDTAARVVE